ncbi:MAG: hypothetical protein LBD89_04910 [Tannerellaceae bacterium]|nr:hypothetical protein [Tannerellaceae bacterium]
MVQYSRISQIYNNASMILVGFSWNFNKGKAYSEKNKQRQNRDTDSGVFYQ